MSCVDGFLFCVSSLVFRVQGFVFRVSCFVLRASCFGFLCPDPWFQIPGFRTRCPVSGSVLRDSGAGFGFRVPYSGSRLSGFEFRFWKKIAGCRFRVRTSDFGCRVSGLDQLGVDSEEQCVAVWTRNEDHCGTCKTVKARFWPWRSGKSPSNVVTCSLFTRKRQELEQLGADSGEQDLPIWIE